MEEQHKLPTDPYKGVRDFYPDDMAVQKYLFETMRKTVESFGYVEYGASILEPSELYRSKTSDEIVNEQTYTFTDRGERSVTLRPEMTPTLARMISAKRRDLGFPIRWYSIPNVFRYERPQRGRLREHWQLNVDIFGVPTLHADAEIIEIAHTILTRFGLSQDAFVIKINDREAFDTFLAEQGLSPEEVVIARSLIDKKSKVSDFDGLMMEKLGKKISLDMPKSNRIVELERMLAERGIHNVVFTPELVRGFTYYTGVVFEVFDTHPENNRSLFGGGRYDNLTALFDNERIPAVGFGMGDVTIRDTLSIRDMLKKAGGSADVAILTMDDSDISLVHEIANELRDAKLHVEVDYTDRKISDKIAKAGKRGTKIIMCIGDNEKKSNLLSCSILSQSAGYENFLENVDRNTLILEITKKITNEKNNI